MGLRGACFVGELETGRGNPKLIRSEKCKITVQDLFNGIWCINCPVEDHWRLIVKLHNVEGRDLVTICSLSMLMCLG